MYCKILPRMLCCACLVACDKEIKEAETKPTNQSVKYTQSSGKPLDSATKSDVSTTSFQPKSFPKTGKASYYAEKFHGKPTASGELYDKNKLTAAHKILPFGTKLKVTRSSNGATVIVKVNDRGPHSKTRIIDLSRAAAEKIGLVQTGTAEVKLEVVE